MLYYDGKRQKATSNSKFENINPATGRLIGQVEMASQKDFETALDSSQKGFEIWSEMAPAQRGKVLKNAAGILRKRNDKIAKIEVEDTGKPISEALKVDIFSGADAIDYYGGIAPTLHGHHYNLGESFAYTRREPLGICAGIGAWNYPLQIAAWKSAPALACGNAMIFKPSELTPRTALILAEIYTEAGLPNGVFNVLQGDSTVGKMLTRSRSIRKVSLTGEVSTGKKVMAAASDSLKHVTLELGGKSPLLIFEDADIEEAVKGAMLGNFYTQGEICSNGTRVYVHRSIVRQFLEKLVKKTDLLRVGDPSDPDTQVGALISENHLEKVLNYIEKGKREAKLLTGGNRFHPTDEKMKGGYFVEPTIFYTENDDVAIAREEIFGPVMTVLPFEKEEEVIHRANNTPYGLSAGLFTKDLQRAHRVIGKLEAGTCWINNYNITPVEIPFGPYKESGLGRENGLITIEAYSQLKTVYVEMNKIDSPY